MGVPVVKADKPQIKKKNEVIKRISKLSGDYQSIILMICDNVNSNQMKRVRNILIDDGVFLMGKNTLFRRGLLAGPQKSKLDKVIPQVFGNVGLFFTNKNLKEMRDKIESVSEMAPVRINMVSQCDVIIPKGVTSLPPDKTNFFQAVNITTMINRSNIQILSDVHLLKKGQKVGASEAALMQMLDIRPFSYRLRTKYIFDSGMAYPPDVLDITQKDILCTFQSALSDIACLSLSIAYPTRPSIPHVFSHAMRELIGLCMEADISNPTVDAFKDAALSAVQVAASQSAVPEPEVRQAPAPAAAPESEEEEMDEGLGDLFGF